MAAFTLGSVTGATASNGTQNVTPVVVVGKDGAGYVQPAMDEATRPGYVRLCDGTNSVTLVDSANLPVASRASATGGATPYTLIVAASANATVVKASAGTLFTVNVQSVVAGVRYLKIYDLSGSPTSSDTPKLRVTIPGSTSGVNVSIPLPACGVAFANGIGIRVVTGQADNDNTSVTAGDCIINIVYQ